MISLGVPESEIPKFADAYYWCSYFPKHTREHLEKFGLGVDWRRSFITTDINPYYDSFVRWQFEHLKEKGKIHFGKRFAIYSPKDGQPCADHDRSTGEGVNPQEYTLIKLELVEPYPPKLQSLQGKFKKISLVAGTLRPETMYGQTNCWILPDGTYGVFQISDSEAFICTERSARNLSFQKFSLKFGETKCLMEIKGWDILGIPVKAPLSKYPIVYTLPMLTISPKKGTAIVTSVPSDSPDDYINFEEFKKKPAFREKFKLKDHMIMPYEVIPIIDIPELGDLAAKTTCEKLNIKSPNDTELLEKAKGEVYEQGFYKGKIKVGEYAGKPVHEAKPIIRQLLIDSGQAIPYAEPEKEVISRSGDVCVVALTDQWFIDYGEPKWRAEVEELLKNMELYSEECRHKFEKALLWLNQWACSRTYGLGTRLPWDEQYLIESLSDSTIYMAYYSIAHLLQGGIVDGSKVGPAGISPKQLTRKVWDYIFLRGSYPSDCGIPEATLQKLRQEFEYWYPLDLRVSGKDLITNHLVFFLYNHVAIFPKDKYPLAIRANGHITLDGDKMSKSTGNFLTLHESIERYSADGTRITLADGSDSLNDANFETKSADAIVLKLWKEIKWIEEMLASTDLRSGPSTFADKVFESQINQAIEETDKHYERTNFREALKSGFYDLQTARDNYRLSCPNKMKKELIDRFIEVQTLLLSPFAPHVCDHIWKMIGKKGCIRKALWPKAGPVDKVVLKQNEYLKKIFDDIRSKKEMFAKMKNQKPSKAIIHVAKGYPEWQAKALNSIRPLFITGKENPSKEELVKILGTSFEKKEMPKVMSYINRIISVEIPVQGMIALDPKTLLFDEKEFLESSLSLLQSTFELEYEIQYAEEKHGDKITPENPRVLIN